MPAMMKARWIAAVAAVALALAATSSATALPAGAEAPAGTESIRRRVTKLSASCDDVSSVIVPMRDADADGNGYLSKREYVVFANAASGGYLAEMAYDDGFTRMPLSLQETYLVLSCLCELYPNQPWGGEGCCETGGPNDDASGIRTNWTEEGEEPTKQEMHYLTYVCGTMADSLLLIGTDLVAPPTASPKEMPTDGPTTEQPTKSTSSTTAATGGGDDGSGDGDDGVIIVQAPPSTRKPKTKRPTRNPTGRPTRKPTGRPTRKPTSMAA